MGDEICISKFLKGEIAKASRGYAPGPHWGAYSAPQTPSCLAKPLRGFVLWPLRGQGAPYHLGAPK